ncbi:MAG: GH116 family glycosyl hydrolase [candidate division KSB1 bacterium]|nr:GH116 family glycosyl hydrolase [candidate division KSB1 bacterium]MDZ7384912.1 GH116 family glycosyl hydrolase [candidate division KSB1 bacterium]MDZ7391966.1 GH116 family glycosyl hydrolase [candidate division KSB1 bacterium]
MKRMAIAFCITVLTVQGLVLGGPDQWQPMPKFAIENGPLTLQRPVQPGTYCEAVGRKAALLGHEEGIFEAWVYPFKVLHGLQLAVLMEGQAYPFDATRIARTITVRPEALTIVYSDPSFTLRQTCFTPLEEPGIVILLDVETQSPLSLVVSFFPDLNPMWPGGMGGQFCYWDEENQLYVISESRFKYSAAIGSPYGRRLSSPPAHELATSPMRFLLHVEPGESARYFLPIVIAGSTTPGLEGLRATYRRLLVHAEELLADTRAHYDRLQRDFLALNLPDPELELAFNWARVALDKGLVDNPHLGRGLVAGYGTSGVGRRPGFAWFFGGDAFMNSMAMNAYGDFATVREAFRFLQRRQRADGKMMHELSQAGGLLPWFEEYPYGYIHGDITPFYIVQMADYLRASGDIAFVRASWESLLKAYHWCLGCDEDGDGLMDNSKAGLGAAELGSLRQNIRTDIYVAGLWVQALRSLESMAQALGKGTVARDTRTRYARALSALQTSFANPEKGLINFALAKEGGVNDEVTSWPAVPLLFGLFPPAQAAPMLDRFASAELSTDWGTRMLSNQSAAYEPLSYNNGAVWPFLTGYVSMAEYRYGRSVSGFLHLMDIARLTTADALGYHTELLAGDRYRALDTSVPHQLFGASQFVHALVRGMLGLQGDALQRVVQFSPQVPSTWKQFEVNNYRLGDHLFHFRYMRTHSGLRIECRHEGQGQFQFTCAPFLPHGSTVHQVRVNGLATPFTASDSLGPVHCSVKLPLETAAVVEIDYTAGLSLVPPVPSPHVGDPPQGLKLIRHSSQNDWHILTLEGRGARQYELLLHSERPITEAQGLTLERRGDGLYAARLQLEAPSDQYVRHEVKVRLQ